MSTQASAGAWSHAVSLSTTLTVNLARRRFAHHPIFQAVGDPTLVRRFASARVLLGGTADLHLPEWRGVVALPTAPPNERPAEAVNRLQFVMGYRESGQRNLLFR